MVATCQGGGKCEAGNSSVTLSLQGHYKKIGMEQILYEVPYNWITDVGTRS